MAGDKYDVIIIGAGVGGLVCGNYLARSGKKVLIAEHGNRIGGNISGIRRKGYFFDAGSQSTENVGILFTILRDLGIYNPDDWCQADWRWKTPDCDVVLRDFAQVRRDFASCFPESAADINKWFDFIEPGTMLMKEMMKEPFPLLKRGVEKLKLSLKLAKVGLPLFKTASQTLRKSGSEKAREIFRDPRLAFLFGEFGNENMLLFMYYAFWYSFLYDYTYPRGGLVALAEMLADNFLKLGGEIKTSCTIDRILTSGSTAIGVETSQGETFFAEKIVNTGNTKRLVTEMCDPALFPKKFVARNKGGEVSISVITAFLGLDIGDEEMLEKHKVHHVLYWRTHSAAQDIYDPDLHKKSWAMTSWCSMHDKSLAPQGKNSMIVQVPMPYDWMNGWGTGSSDPTVRTEEYRKLKAKVLDDIIESMEDIIPGIGGKVEVKDLATPRTLSRYTLNPQGSIMGWSYDMYKTPLAGRFAQFKTPVKNLYLAGHYSIWPGGIVFSALTGKLVAEGMYEGFGKSLLW